MQLIFFGEGTSVRHVQQAKPYGMIRLNHHTFSLLTGGFTVIETPPSQGHTYCKK